MDWETNYPSRRSAVMADEVVATSQPLAAQAGLDVLSRGGNAVDAAIAAAAALTVVEPVSNGIGSDAFAIVWDGEALHGFNGSGRAPAAWSPERFAGLDTMPLTGWDAVTVPGAVDTWAQLHGRFGTADFESLLAPAIHYARHGFHVGPVVASSWQRGALIHGGETAFADTFLPAPDVGTRRRLPDHARTLESIAADRGESFYRGELAARMVADARAHGGALTLEDLSEHRGVWVDTIRGDLGGVTVHEIPPNGQGIAALIALGILDAYGPVDPTSPSGMHVQIEAMKLAFAATHAEVADPDAMRLTPSDLLAPEALRAGAARIDPKAARPGGDPSRDRGTVYLTVGDRSGMMVSFIQSNFWGFGSGVVVPGTGIALQNRGHGFSLEPGHPNEVGGGKRPFHTIIPAFAMRDGAPWMSFGVMGGPFQPQGHVQVLTRILAGAHPQAAVDARRWQVMRGGQLMLEEGFCASAASTLRGLGHEVVTDGPAVLFGGAQLAMCLPGGGYLAASDPRKDGCAVGR